MGGYVGARAGSLLATTAAEVQDLTATDTTPEVTIVNSTHEDTDGGREGKVTFKGQQSGGEETTLAQIQASHDGTSDDEKGDLIFKTNDGSDGSSPTERVRIDSSGNVGIGMTPTYKLDISGEALRIKNTSGTGYIIDQNANSSVSHILYENSFMRFGTNSAERMRIDSSGNLNIGSDTNAGHGPLQLGSTSSANTIIQMLSSTSGNTGFYFGDTTSGADRFIGYMQYAHGNNSLQFGANGAERFRVDSNGVAIFGLSAQIGNGDQGCVVDGPTGSIATGKASTNARTHISFINPNGTVGSITTTGSGTAFNESSDYRLKENITDISDGITRVKQLLPRRFNFIADADSTVDGFLAHEAQTVVPEAIYGTKDEVEVWKDGDELPDGVSVGDNKLDDDGKTIPVMQAIDKSKLVPLLTAALQEAIGKIETLETKVAALEG